MGNCFSDNLSETEEEITYEVFELAEQFIKKYCKIGYYEESDTTEFLMAFELYLQKYVPDEIFKNWIEVTGDANERLDYILSFLPDTTIVNRKIIGVSFNRKLISELVD